MSTIETDQETNVDYDLESGFLKRYFEDRSISYSIIAVPGHHEPEIKIIHPPERFPQLEAAIRARRDIIFCEKGVQSKNGVLVNFDLDTYDPDSDEKTMLIHKAGYQARFRTRLTIDGKTHKFDRMEFNIKSNLTRHTDSSQRKEYEAHSANYAESFNHMVNHDGVTGDDNLDLHQIDQSSLFIPAIPITSRAHREFGRIMPEYGCVLRYLSTGDHTVHTDNMVVKLDEDCESEYEIRDIYILHKEREALQRPLEMSDSEIEEMMNNSQTDLKDYLISFSPKDLWNAHKSKVGRAEKALSKARGLKKYKDIAIKNELAKRITVDHFLGKTKHPLLTHEDFNLADRLVTLVNGHLLTSDDLANDYIRSDNHSPLDPALMPMHA